MLDKRKLRFLMKKGECTFITHDLVCTTFGLTKRKGQEFLNELEKNGYIEIANIKDCWIIAMRGMVLANQKFERSYKVNVQKEHLQGFMDRIITINASPEFAHLVLQAKLISEYPIQNRNSGLNIVYSLIRKKMSQEKYLKLSHKLGHRSNKTFYSIIDELIYPEIALNEALKARSPILKLRKVEAEDMPHYKGYMLFDSTVTSSNP